jgi:hypothetical protein
VSMRELPTLAFSGMAIPAHSDSGFAQIVRKIEDSPTVPRLLSGLYGPPASASRTGNAASRYVARQ